MPKIDSHMRVRTHIMIRDLASGLNVYDAKRKLREIEQQVAETDPAIHNWICRNTDGFVSVAANAISNFVIVDDDNDGYIQITDTQSEFEPDILLYASREAQKRQRVRAERLAISAAKRLKTFWIKTY